MNPTLSGDCSKPLFSHYKKPYMVYFQKHKNPTRKTLKFTKNSESKKSFSQNTLKSIFFLLGHFLALIFEFNITNHFLIGL